MPASTKDSRKTFGQYRDSVDFDVTPGNTLYKSRAFQTFNPHPNRKGVVSWSVDGAEHGAVLRVFITASLSLAAGNPWTQVAQLWVRSPQTEGELLLDVPARMGQGNHNTPRPTHLYASAGFITPVDVDALRRADERGWEYHPPQWENYRATLTLVYSEVESQ